MTASCPSIRLYQRRGISINVCLFTDLISLFAKLPSTSNKCILFFFFFGINKLFFFLKGIRRRRSWYDNATDLVTREHWTLDLRGLN